MREQGKSYRLGVIGFAHMHINELIDRFAALPNVTWVACADTVPAVPSRTDVAGSRRANLRRALERTGIPRCYDHYQEMLEQEELDIVLFCPENARHGEVAEALAARRIHMVTEKPMAASLSEALRMARAARHAGVSLMVNWPVTWNPAVRKAQALLAAGEIGQVWEVKWRNGASLGPLAHGSAHPAGTVVSGPVGEAELGAEWWYRTADGGGALLDYCCYGAMLAAWLIGQPAQAAYGLRANLRSPFGDADDNAIITVRFPTALAILEGTWTTFHSGIPTGPIVYGSHGTLVVDRRQVLVYKDRGSSEPTAVYEGDPLPAGRQTLAEEFIHHLETGEPLHPTLDVPLNLQAMAILDAGLRSAASGKLELVNDQHWCIG